jgi:hypothetical protein
MEASLPQRPDTQENREYFLLLDAATKPRCQHRKRGKTEPCARLTAVYLLRVCIAAVAAQRPAQGENALACLNNKETFVTTCANPQPAPQPTRRATL